MDNPSALFFIRQGAEVVRYHSTKTIQEETNGMHMHGVAMLCYLLSDLKPSVDLLMAALTHDLAEQDLGDMPAPAKRKLGIGKVFYEAELELLLEHRLAFHLNDADQHVLDLADVLDGLLTTLRERQMGNQLIEFVFNNYSKYFEEIAKTGHELGIEDQLAWQLYYAIKTKWKVANEQRR